MVRNALVVVNNGLCGQRSEMVAPADMPTLIGINGRTHDPAPIDVDGTMEIWEIVSVGMLHPFHAHGAMFGLPSLDSMPPPAHLASCKDVALVESKAASSASPSRRGASTPLMYHCHILEHEDAGMMGEYTCARDLAAAALDAAMC